jgi:RimJ/RimL family protein N-acetyltransferase
MEERKGGGYRLNEASLSDLALMELKAAALFTYDATGRMVGSNEPEPERAPRLFLGRTTDGLIWRVRDDVPAEIVARMARLLADEPLLTDPRHRPATFAALCEALETEAPITSVWEGPAWHFPASFPAPEGVVAIGTGNLDLIRDHFPYTANYVGEREPCFAVVADGIAVSVCYSSRSTPKAAEAGVNTEEAYRGRGYAAKVVAAWASAVRSDGRIPIYSASWDNTASQAVARRLGLVLYGTELSLS